VNLIGDPSFEAETGWELLNLAAIFTEPSEARTGVKDLHIYAIPPIFNLEPLQPWLRVELEGMLG
jgi:hypothetical protein